MNDVWIALGLTLFAGMATFLAALQDPMLGMAIATPVVSPN